MTFEITLGLWLIPAVLSIAALWWLFSQDYRGDYNFTALFTVPTTAFVICFVWMVYFGLAWAFTKGQP